MITSKEEKTYGKLANLNVIDTERLFFLAGTQAQHGDEFAEEIEGTQDQARANEGVCASCERVGKLVAKLDPVVVEPASRDDGGAVEVRNVVTWEGVSRVRLISIREDLRSEKGSQKVADEPANTVHSEDIECIIAAEEVLQLRCIVAAHATSNTEYDSSPGRHISRPRGNGHQASNHARAEADGGPLALQTVVDQTPRDATHTSSEIRAHSRHDSPQICRQRGSSVEAEPTHPQKYGADDDVRDVVGAVVELLGSMSTPLAQHVRVGERSRSGRNMHGCSASKVQAAQLKDPPGGIPSPAGDGVVDDGSPDKHVDDAWKHSAPLGDGSHGKGDAALC